MGRIAWGPEIEINGKRPDWIEDDCPISWIEKGWSLIWYGKGFLVRANEIRWSDRIRAIKVPADHWFYKGLNNVETSFKDSGYDALEAILNEAYKQAASGKGKERHANGNTFERQPIAEIGRMVGVGFNTGQAIKKLQESSRMEPDAACRELLGAIVYAASAIMLIREDSGE